MNKLEQNYKIKSLQITLMLVKDPNISNILAYEEFHNSCKVSMEFIINSIHELSEEKKAVSVQLLENELRKLNI